MTIVSSLPGGPAKPPHGAPCNSCGICCVHELCPLAVAIFHRQLDPKGRCPAVSFEGGRSRCGLITAPMQWAPTDTMLHGAQAMSEAASQLIAAGEGCDTRINDEPANDQFYAQMRIAGDRDRSKINRARRLWRA